MPNNRTRNRRRNKQKNALAEQNKKTLDVEENISSANSKHLIIKKEVSVNVKRTVEDPEVCKIENNLNYFNISNPTPEKNVTYASISKNYRENSNELKSILKEEKCSKTVTEFRKPYRNYRENSDELSIPKEEKCTGYETSKTVTEFRKPYRPIDVEKNISSTNSKHLIVKKEVSVNVKHTVEDPEVCKMENSLNYLKISNPTPKKSVTYASITKNFRENSNELKSILKEEKCTGYETSKTVTEFRKPYRSIECDYGRKAQPFVNDTYTKKVQPFIESNSVKKAQPSNEYSYKTQSCIENNYSVKKSNSLVQHTPENKSFSAFTTKGAKPKTEKKFGNSNLNANFKDGKDSPLFKRHEKIQGGMRRYESHWEIFDRLYRTWKNQRQNTIQKLQELVENVHKDQRMFNQGNVFLKELNVGSREVKNCNTSPTIDFLTSFAAFVTDAASGITSAVQACNVDNYTTAFKEIVENDAKITRPLHAARSQCLEEYRNVEEIIRQCHLDTFGSTMENISSTLKVEDLWSDIKNAKGENTIGQIIDSVDAFIRKNANIEVVGEVCDSIQCYLNSNPAALEACKSAGKALYGVCDTWGRDHKQGRNSIAGNMSIISNKMLLIKERQELCELRSIADNDQESQAKLESEIHKAISSLQNEMQEINKIFERKNPTHNSNPWYF